MNNNRLTPYQMAIGNTADATRIEQCLMRLAELYDDVPPEFVQRRWSPSPLVWGFTPPQLVGSTSFGLPFLPNVHSDTLAGKPTCNPQRVKSCAAPGLTAAQHRTWEVSCLFSRPKIIGSLAVFAESCRTNGLPSSPKNNWRYGVTPPAPFDEADPTQDFTLQVTISDGWDLENRKKLRQESLTYQTRSDAFEYSQCAISGAFPPTAQPKSPHNSKWTGFAVTTQALVLVPAGARVLFQWTIPQYANNTDSTWPLDPRTGNVWSLSALCYSPTVRR